jgi:hypothetical protein
VVILKELDFLIDESDQLNKIPETIAFKVKNKKLNL